MNFRPLKKAAVQEELMVLTRNTSQAILLDQFLSWTRRCHEFDETLAAENHRRAQLKQDPVNIEFSQGWFCVSLASLAETSMILSSKSSLRSFVESLISQGWIETKAHQTSSKKCLYRVNLETLSTDLKKLGYQIPGFACADSIVPPSPSSQQKVPISPSSQQEMPTYNPYIGQPYLMRVILYLSHQKAHEGNSSSASLGNATFSSAMRSLKMYCRKFFTKIIEPRLKQNLLTPISGNKSPKIEEANESSFSGLGVKYFSWICLLGIGLSTPLIAAGIQKKQTREIPEHNSIPKAPSSMHDNEEERAPCPQNEPQSLGREKKTGFTTPLREETVDDQRKFGDLEKKAAVTKSK